MGRVKREETGTKTFRLPVRLIKMFERAAQERQITTNNLFWRVVEDFLAKHGYLKKEDRKREPLR